VVELAIGANGRLKYSFLLNFKLGPKWPFTTDAKVAAKQSLNFQNGHLDITAI
jgi:hypothetical protein